MLSDVREWAFDQNARELEAHLKDRFDFTHFYVLDWVRGLQPLPEFCRFDVIYCSYHPWGVELGVPWERTLGALCSQYFDPTRKHLPGPEEFAIVNRFRAFHTVERSSYEACRAGCPQVHYITNPVDVTRFAPAPLSASPVVACWNGNAQHSNGLHEDVKGFYSIVHPACKRAGVPLVFAEAGSCRKQPSEMPGFYQRANLAVCASLYEGASRSIMESMASGLAVLATDCGNHREMQQSQLQEYGETGIHIVPRNVDAFASELARLRDDPELVAEMGQLNRAEIERAWSWPAWRDRYAAFLSIPLETRVATAECSAEPEASTSVAASAVSLPVCELPPSTGRVAGVCSTPADDLSSEVTVFFVTTGDPVAATAWSALERQNCGFVLERIENVAPMSAAFQQMIVRCRTPYFIQVDEDMILKPGAVRTLYETIRRQPDDVFMYAYMLWDVHLVRGIFGVKAYRHSLMRLVEYRDVQSCEQDHFKRLEAMGYKYAVPGWSDATLTYGSPQVQGQHGTLYTPRAAFERYLDLTEKYRDVGGSDWYMRYPYEFLTRLLGEERLSSAGSLEQLTDFWALAGAVCGLFSDLSLPRKEKDFRLPPRGFGELRSHIVAPPQEGIIYSTSRCNGKCPHCSRTLTEHASVPDFTLALTRRMLKYYPSMRGVCVAGFGEPTLNEDLPAIVSTLRERSIVVGVVTNGLRSADAAGHLVPGLTGASYVSFSLNATDREEHERMYGVADGWSRVTRGIEAACRAGVPPTLSFIVTKQTWGRIPEYLKVSSSLISGVPGARVALVNLLPHHHLDDKAAHADFLARTLSTSDDLSALSEYKSMACALGLNVFVWPTPINPDGPPRMSSCNSPFTRLGVDGAERVSPCSRITPPGEQFGQLTPSAWWASSGIRDLRRQIAGVLPLRWECRYCFGNYSSF
jgi:MoaA/NifB/PqqE/SkfB family radical SAM enzyme/glycosyltransferase involved in cell wall biosynthesis